MMSFALFPNKPDSFAGEIFNAETNLVHSDRQLLEMIFLKFGKLENL